MKLKKHQVKNVLCTAAMVLLLFPSFAASPKIVVQRLQMKMPLGQKNFSEGLLKGEIAETQIEHLAYVGPVDKTMISPKGNICMFLFIKGKGKLNADTMSFNLVPESIAIPFHTLHAVHLEVAEGDTLHLIRFTKKLSAQDREDMAGFPTENTYDLYFTRFDDCEPYTEKIKSPNTVSRTVLPADIIPRVALGTVEAPGPDEVGAHKHPMLDQLFLGLTDNDIVVHADGASAPLKAYELLHIPIGSSHWVSVDKNKKMYYMWMDFFLTKEGQEWLKTHKPIRTDKNEY